mgnify:FL=1
MNPYQKAIKALEDCVKDAMENNIDPGLQSEIWRHYQGMKAIDRQLPDNPKFSFKLDALDDAMDYINIPSGPYAADTISLNTGGDDVITFEDYKSQEYRFD